MDHGMLRALAKFLIGIGWAHPLLGLIAGFVPWIMFMGQPIPIWFPWERWLIYASPILGLGTGIVTGVAYLVAGHIILMLLDYGATLDGILDGIRQLVRLRQPHGTTAKRDVFAGDGIETGYREKTF